MDGQSEKDDGKPPIGYRAGEAVAWALAAAVIYLMVLGLYLLTHWTIGATS